MSVARGEDLWSGLAVRAEADGTFGSHGDATEYDRRVGAGNGGRLREQGCCGEEQESDVEAVHRNLPVLLYVANQNVTLLTVASSSGERKMSGMRASARVLLRCSGEEDLLGVGGDDAVEAKLSGVLGA